MFYHIKDNTVDAKGFRARFLELPNVSAAVLVNGSNLFLTAPPAQSFTLGLFSELLTEPQN